MWTCATHGLQHRYSISLLGLGFAQVPCCCSSFGRLVASVCQLRIFTCSILKSYYDRLQDALLWPPILKAQGPACHSQRILRLVLVTLRSWRLEIIWVILQAMQVTKAGCPRRHLGQVGQVGQVRQVRHVEGECRSNNNIKGIDSRSIVIQSCII